MRPPASGCKSVREPTLGLASRTATWDSRRGRLGKRSRHQGHGKVRRSSIASGSRGENTNGPDGLPEQLRGLEPAEQSHMLVEMMAKASVAEHEKCVDALRVLGMSCDPELLYLAHVLQTMVVPQGTASEESHGPAIARCDWVARTLQTLEVAGSRVPGESGVEQMLQLSDEAVMAASMVAGSRASERCEEAELKLLLSGLASEMQTVRGSAYPEQVFSRMQSSLGRFDGFFQTELGATVGQLGEALFSTVRTMEAKVSEAVDREFEEHAELVESLVEGGELGDTPALGDGGDPALATFWIMAGALPVRRDEVVGASGEPPSVAVWNALVELVGCSLNATHCEPPPEPFLFLPMPMVVLRDGAVVVHDITTALENLAERLSERLAANANLAERWNKARGAHAEERAFEALERVLGRPNVFRNLTYPDPEKSGGQAEIDAVGVWAGWVVLVEVKAKRHFRFGDLGEVGRLRTDIKNNVHDGFLQASRAKRYMDTNDVCTLKERSGEARVLNLNRAEIQGTLLLSVSLEHLDGLAFQLQASRQLGLFQSGEFPWSVSVSDLEIVCKHCEGPDVFIHYAKSRHEFMHGGKRLITDELRLFGWYLDTRCRMPGMDKADVISLCGYHVQFDQWEDYLRNDRPDCPSIRLKIPDWIRLVLQELRSRTGDAAAQRLALKILDLSQEALERLGRDVPIAVETPSFGSGVRRLELTGAEPAVLVLVGDPQARDDWANAVRQRLLLFKYRARVRTALALGIMRGDPRPVSTVTWCEGEWQRSPEMDAQLALEVPMVVHGMNLPGRNEKCFCGSGKKFKHCCIDRVARRS